MSLELPEIPSLVLTLVNIFAPYLIAVVNQPEWSAMSKRLISVAGSLLLSAVSLWFYYQLSGEPVPNLPVLLLLGVLVSQTAYALVEKPSAKIVERKVLRGDHRADTR